MGNKLAGRNVIANGWQLNEAIMRLVCVMSSNYKLEPTVTIAIRLVSTEANRWKAFKLQMASNISEDRLKLEPFCLRMTRVPPNLTPDEEKIVLDFFDVFA